MLYLFSKNSAASHKVQFLQLLIRLIIAPPQGFLICYLPNFSRLNFSRSLYINRPTNFVDSTVPSWVIGQYIILLFEFKILNNGIDFMLFPVFHISRKHFNYFRQIKFSGSAKPNQIGIKMPRILCNIICDDPFFKLSEALLLLFTKVSDVPPMPLEHSFFFCQTFSKFNI